MTRATERAGGDLTVTALYTSAAWAWGKLPCAELLACDEARRVFAATNFALAVTSLFKRAQPSLRHSLVQRHLIIDALVAESGITRVVELAAGLSRRGVALSADPRVFVTEVDRAPVVERKRALLSRTEAGRAALARSNFELIAADLAEADLAGLVTAPPDEKLFVIAEGLLMYLRAEEQRAFWARVGKLLAGRGGTLVFDLVPVTEQAPPGLLGRVLGWLMRRFTRGTDFARDERTRADILRELGEAGFSATWLEPRAVLDRFKLPYGDIVTQQLVFEARMEPARAGG